MTAVSLETAARAAAHLRATLQGQRQNVITAVLTRDEAEALLGLVESIIPAGDA